MFHFKEAGTVLVRPFRPNQKAERMSNQGTFRKEEECYFETLNKIIYY